MFARAILIAWIAVLGADRVDLLGGHGPALLLPFHVLTLAALGLEWRRRLAARSLPALTREGTTFIALVLALLALVALSILRSADVTMSLGRAVLLGAVAIGVPLVLWAAADREDLLVIFARGAQWGLAAALVFNVLALLSVIGLAPSEVEAGPALVQLATPVYGTIPRLSGATLDMNRGGLVALLHVLLILLARPPLRGRYAWAALGALFVVGSLSRSVLLCAVPAMLLMPRLQGTRRGARLALATLLGVLAVGSATLLHPGLREASARAASPLTERFRLREGSAQEHARLLERARETALQDIPTTLLGIGYGTSFRVLGDIFAGNPYGNFHSTWFTFWAESGVFAMLALLALFVAPLRHRGPLTGVLLGLVAYNTFYNGFLEPLLWVVLTLAWLTPQVLAPVARRQVTA